MERRKIGTVENYYGGIYVTEVEGKYYWMIQDHDTIFDSLAECEEISKELFDSLNVYQNNLE